MARVSCWWVLAVLLPACGKQFGAPAGAGPDETGAVALGLPPTSAAVSSSAPTASASASPAASSAGGPQAQAPAEPPNAPNPVAAGGAAGALPSEQAAGAPAPSASASSAPEPSSPEPAPSSVAAPEAGTGGSAPLPSASSPDAVPPAGEQPPAPTPGACAAPPLEPSGTTFDCGDAHIFENNGPPENRVNYVIVADGYLESELDTALVEHVENMLYNEETGMFSEIGQPYTRYRRFINVCTMRSPSNESGVDGPGGNPDRDTAFDGGNCGDRLGCVDERLVTEYLSEALPEQIDPDWTAATMNANEWWNSGGQMMVWSGKFMETSDTQSASVALHEGGHAFHQLADEYGDEALNCNCESAREPNVACENEPSMSAESKWGEWMGFVMEGGSRLWNLGEHGAVPGGRYCGPSSGVVRPTEDSEMNLLPYAHNMPSIQKMIHDIYEIVRPIDAHTPNDAPLSDVTELQVRIVDPEVLLVEWSVDGQIDPAASGECFDLTGLTPGEHTVRARVYDDTPWVRDQRDDLEESVEWSVTVP